MGTWTLKYDTAGLFDFLPWRKPAQRVRKAALLQAAPAVAAVASAPREIADRRAAAMRGFFPKLSAWMAKRAYLMQMHEINDYLSQSTDIFDLERRIRNIERQDRIGPFG